MREGVWKTEKEKANTSEAENAPNESSDKTIPKPLLG